MRRDERCLRIILLLLVSFAAASGCSTAQRARVETTLATALISDEQSNQIGEQVHADLQKNGMRYVDDPVIRAYVEQIGGRIFALGKEDRPRVGYHVHLIDDPSRSTPSPPLGDTSSSIPASCSRRTTKPRWPP
jgi:predicted Zn-dependent protease